MRSMPPRRATRRYDKTYKMPPASAAYERCTMFAPARKCRAAFDAQNIRSAVFMSAADVCAAHERPALPRAHAADAAFMARCERRCGSGAAKPCRDAAPALSLFEPATR